MMKVPFIFPYIIDNLCVITQFIYCRIKFISLAKFLVYKNDRFTKHILKDRKVSHNSLIMVYNTGVFF